jgi:hypothetical protein
MTSDNYVGHELEIFSHAVKWKEYWSSEIRPYILGDVLEVGAGLGVNTPFLKSAQISSWTCLEPDPELCARMQANFMAQPQLADCQQKNGTTETLGSGPRFNTILYIDVLEHIEGDHAELERASNLLRIGGRIVVVAPAHQWLYTAFDRAIGHHRRYTRLSLSDCSPQDCEMERLCYLDSLGILASSMNRVFLRRDMPKLSEIEFWDRFLVPASRILDSLTFHRIGKSLLGVWRKLG